MLDLHKSYACKSILAMNILEEIIEGMNKDEVRSFKLLASRIEYGFDRKDIQLFSILRKDYSKKKEDQIIERIYKQAKRNTYYRLRNRLHAHLNKSLILHHFENDEELSVLLHLSLYRLFFKKGNLNVARFYLSKAERKSMELEKFDWLDMIYTEFIKLSNEQADINPEVYVQQQIKNSEQLHQLREIDHILATVTYRLRISQNFSGNDISLIHLLERTVRDFSCNKKLVMSVSLQLRLAEAVSKVLLQKHDYKALADYLISTRKKFEKGNIFTKQSHHTKLTLLTYLINALYFIGKHELSLNYAELLYGAMLEHDKYLFDRYLIFYYNTKVINYSAFDKPKAIALLEELKATKAKLGYYEFYVYLNLAVLYFDTAQFDKSIRHVLKAYLFDSFSKADDVFQLKVAIAELMIRTELKETDVVKLRIRQIEKDFSNVLNGENQKRECEMLAIMKQMVGKNSRTANEKLRLQMATFLKKTARNYSDEAEILKYNGWVKSKIETIQNR